MKISYNEATGMECSSLAQDLVLCEATGYDYIEIRIDMLRNYLETHTVGDLKSFFDNSRLRPHAFNALYINFATDAQWAQILSDYKLICEVGEKIGDHYVVVVPGIFEGPASYSQKAVFEDSVKRLELLSDMGRDYGMKLGWEPVGDAESCVRTVREAWDIVKAVGREDVGVTLDAFNLYVYNKLDSFEDMRMIDTDKIFMVHMDDSDDKPLKALVHGDRCFPGDGVLNLGSFVGTLKDMGYDGVFSVETFRPGYWEMDPEWVIRTGYEKTKRFLDTIYQPA
jgi:2-keto-myo-inositol isomerase